MIRRLPLIAIFLLVGGGGCTTTHSFDIRVTNRSTTPVTVWLTKTAGPYEDGWQPPEALALQTTSDTHIGGVIVAPGKSCGTKMSAQFESDQRAVLRVYRAVHFDRILAISHGSPDRFDYILTPGRNDLDVVAENGQVTVEPHPAK